MNQNNLQSECSLFTKAHTAADLQSVQGGKGWEDDASSVICCLLNLEL